MDEKKVVIVKQENQKDSNTPALIGFIFSLLGCLVIPGLVLSIIGLVNSKNYKNGRKGLAIAGLTISIFVILVCVGLSLSNLSTNTNISNDSNNANYAESEEKETKDDTNEEELKDIIVIDFSNMSRADATKWCEENNLKCDISGSYNDDIEEGKLISQSVSTGTVIKEKSNIKIVYSYGHLKTQAEKEEEEKQAYLNSCQSYTYDEISRNPDNYKDKRAKFEGQVVQVQEVYSNSIILRVDVTKNEYDFWEDTVYVHYTYSDGESRILEDDIITMYGTLNGLKTYTTIFGGSVTIPDFYAKYIFLSQ